MEVYICTDHDGHWPVGVCSIIIANSEHEARGLLAAELHERGLDYHKPFTLRRLNMDKPRALVILDGEY